MKADELRSQVVPSYRLLTEDQIRQIHGASLKLLEVTGVLVDHAEAVEMLCAAGCRIKGRAVLIPGALVEECIHSAPRRIDLHNRNGDLAMRLEGRRSYYGLGTDLIQTYDLHTGELRPSVLQDVVNAARVTEQCENIDFVASFALPHDVPTNTMYAACVKALLENSTKPIFTTAAGVEDLSVIIEMIAAVAGGERQLRERPRFIHYSEPTPPLFHSFGAVGKLFLCADRGVPIVYVPAATSGGSAPVTLSGGIVQANAEALSGLVLHQLRHKGSPIISGFLVVPMDMRAGTFCYGAPETRLTNSAFADLYHHYGIPQWSTVGSDSHIFDQQAAMEHAFSILLSTLDGSNLIHDVGYLGQGLTQNPAMLVMCNEIIAYVKRFTRGFELSEDRIGLAMIDHVGPGGDYMSQDHTLKYYKEELWQPKLTNRDDPEVWKAKGRKTFGDLATRRAIEILESRAAVPMAAETQAQVNAVFAEAEKSLAGKYFKA